MSAGQLLGGLDARDDRIVVADLAAGLANVILASASAPPDLLIVMVEPYLRSAEVTHRLLSYADVYAIPHTLLVANRIDNPDDLDTLAAFLGDVAPDIVMPSDPGVAEADRFGLAPLDHANAGYAVAAVERLAYEVRTVTTGQTAQESRL